MILGKEFSASESAAIIKVMPSTLKKVSEIFCKEKDSKITCKDGFTKLEVEGKDAEPIYQLALKYGTPLYEIIEWGRKPGIPPVTGGIDSYVLEGIYCVDSICTYGSMQPIYDGLEDPFEDGSAAEPVASDPEKKATGKMQGDPSLETSVEQSKQSSSDVTKCY